MFIRISVQNSQVTEAYLIMYPWNEIKQRWHIHDLIVNCTTSHKVFKTAVTLRHMDMMVHVFRHSLQDIIFDAGNLKSDVVFQSLSGKRFIPVYSLLQAAK